MPKKPKKKEERFSLYPLKPEEALKTFMEADPKKLESKLKKLRKKKRKYIEIAK